MKRLFKILLVLTLVFGAFFAFTKADIKAAGERKLTINLLPDGSDTTSATFGSSATYVYQPNVAQKYWYFDLCEYSGSQARLVIAAVTPESGSGWEQETTVNISFNVASAITKVEVDGAKVSDGYYSDYIFKTQDCVMNIYVKDGIKYDAVQATCMTTGHDEYYQDPATLKYYDKYGSEIDNITEWTTDGFGTYPINPNKHVAEKIPAEAPKYKVPGHKEAYKCNVCGKYFKEETLTNLIGEQADYDNWILNEGRLDHNCDLIKVDGKEPKYNEPGYKDAYKCADCGYYFEDEAGTIEIGEGMVYMVWIFNDGKLEHEHHKSKVDGFPATTEAPGVKDCYFCDSCNNYFADEECTILIGTEDNFNDWKLNDGKIPQLPKNGGNGDGENKEKGNGGKVALIIIIVLILLLLIIYLCGYFFLYRKGKLDDSAIKVIYSFLPKPDTKEEQKEEKQEEAKEE